MLKQAKRGCLVIDPGSTRERAVFNEMGPMLLGLYHDSLAQLETVVAEDMAGGRVPVRDMEVADSGQPTRAVVG
jgi:hypothetical protein